MKFNFFEIEQIFSNINNIIDYVNRSKLSKKRNNLFLCSGDNITYSIPNSSISHLVGINTDYLLSTRIFKSQNSFDLLREFCSNAYKIHNLFNNGTLNQSKVFSKNIIEKIENFKENIKIDLYNTEFVCKYNKEKSFYSSKVNEKCDYVIVKKCEDEKVGVLFLVKNNFDYIPMSNRVYNNIDEAKTYLKDLLINQEITLLDGINSFNINNSYNKPINLNPSVKRSKFSNLLEYKKMFNCHTNIEDDYMYACDKLLKKRSQNFINNNNIYKIIDSITEGRIIETQEYNDPTIINIIDAWNNRICDDNSTIDDQSKTKYTDAIMRLQEAEKMIVLLTQTNEQLTNQILNLEQTNQHLTEENKTYKETEEKIFKLLKNKENI